MAEIGIQLNNVIPVQQKQGILLCPRSMDDSCGDGNTVTVGGIYESRIV